MIFEEAQDNDQYLQVGDLVQLVILGYKDEYYKQLVRYRNSDTLGIVLEVFHNSFKKLGYRDHYYLVTVLIDGAKYTTLARHWIKK